MCTALTHNILFNCNGSDSHIVHQILMIAYKKVFFIFSWPKGLNYILCVIH